MPSVHTETKITILVFGLLYLAFLLRKTGSNKLDIFDLIALSSVAVFPILFAFFPTETMILSSHIGVTFPFIVLFGILLAILFMLIHRMTIRLHKLETDNCLLIQEVSILRHHLEQGWKINERKN